MLTTTVYKPRYRLSNKEGKRVISVYRNGAFLVTANLFKELQNKPFQVEQVSPTVYRIVHVDKETDGFMMTSKRRQFFSKELSKNLFDCYCGDEKSKRIYFELDDTDILTFVEER